MAIELNRGVNSFQGNGSLIGQTIAQIRRSHGSNLGVAATDTAYVGGRAVSENYALKDGDSVEFQPRAAEKGRRAVIISA